MGQPLQAPPSGDERMSSRKGGELVAALRHALRDPNEPAEIERTLADLLMEPDELSAYSMRDHLIEMLEHYRQAHGGNQ